MNPARDAAEQHHLRRWVVAMVPPAAALGVQLLWAPFFSPNIWFLFYPAVFLSSWIGGVRAAVVASVSSAAAVLWIVAPPAYSFDVPPGQLVAASVFAVTGVFFGVFHEHLRHASGRAERARHEAELARAALAALVEQAPDGIFVADLDGRYTEVNTVGCRMLGFSRKELIGKTIIDLVPPEKVDQLEREKRLLLAGEVVVSEWSLRRKDGSWIPVEVSARILADGRWQGVVRDISARKRLEDALHASHADLERAQSVASAGSWRLDMRKGELRWSDETYRIFGIPPGTPVTYDAFLGRVHPDDRAHVDREWTAARHGQPYDIEHRILVDGAVRWVREKADLEFDERQVLVGGIGITQDITERKRYEQELREAREYFELALRGADLAAWDWDLQTDRVVYSPRWAEMLGLRPDQVAGHVDAWRSGVHPEDWPRVSRTLEDYLQGRAPEYESEHRLRTGSGEGIWILGRGKVFARDEHGRPTRMAGTALDITLRKRAEEQLRHAEFEASLLAEVGAAFASTLDYEGTLETVARLAVRDLADFCIVDVVVEGEVQRRTVASRDPGQAWICDLCSEVRIDRSRPYLLREVFERVRPVLMPYLSREMIERLAQSEEHLQALQALDPKSVILVPLLAHGKLLGALALVSSTESHTYGPADLRLGEALGLRAALAIENARLYRLAQRAIQARDDILGIVAHDLRNPLGTILMQAELLRRRGGDAARRSRSPADAIERAATRMNRLIEDLLDVTRMEAGRLSMERRRVAPQAVIADSIDAQQALAESGSVELRCDVPKALPDVWGDRDRLLQVFENLVVNAIKFSHPGGLVTIGAVPREGEVLFWVADTGEGIADEDLPHVFDRFWQAAHARQSGAGLGLPIVKGIVEAHGGRVRVESTLRRGSTFFFAIPSARRSEHLRPVPAPRGP